MKQRFTKRTRLVSALLTLAMVCTFLPFSAFAANTASTGIAFNSPDFKLNFPLVAPLVLKVSSGDAEMPADSLGLPNDSVPVESLDSEEENWF